MSEIMIEEEPAELGARELAATLPWVEKRDGVVINLWPVKNLGTFRDDSYCGDLYATMTIQLAKEHRCPGIIGWVLGDMIAAGTLGAHEAGFISRLAHSAYVGSMD